MLPPPPPIVKQPHFVWRKYLQAWEVNGYLHVLRGKVDFKSAADGVATEGGFHDLPTLSDDDVEYLIATCIPRGSPHGQQHREFINFMVMAQRGCATVVANPEAYDELSVAWANKILRDTEETLMTSLEELGLPWLTALRNGDCAFLEQPDNNLFFYFLTTQYLRTKAVAQSVVAGMRGSKLAQFAEKLERTWPLARKIHTGLADVA